MIQTYKRLQGLFDYLWLNWEPETIIEMLKRRGVAELDLDKVFAIQTYIMSDSFFVDSFAFEKIVVASSGRTPDFSLFENVSPLEICTCVRDLRKIPERDYGYFEDVVLEYIIHMFKGNRIYMLPKNLFHKDQMDDAKSEMKKSLNKEQMSYDFDISVLEDIIGE